MSNILAAIRSRDENVSNVRVEVTGILTDSSPVRYSGLELTVGADTSDRALLEHLVEIADRGCIMMNTLRGTLDLRVRVVAESPAKTLARA